MSLSLDGKRGAPPFFYFCFFTSHFCNDLNDGAKPSQPALCNPSRRYAVDDYPLDFDFLVGRCNPAEIALMRAPASFPLFQSSRKIRRTNCLFSEDINPAPLPRTVSQPYGGGKAARARQNGHPGRSGITWGQSSRTANQQGDAC